MSKVTIYIKVCVLVVYIQVWQKLLKEKTINQTNAIVICHQNNALSNKTKKNKEIYSLLDRSMINPYDKTIAMVGDHFAKITLIVLVMIIDALGQIYKARVTSCLQATMNHDSVHGNNRLHTTKKNSVCI